MSAQSAGILWPSGALPWRERSSERRAEPSPAAVMGPVAKRCIRRKLQTTSSSRPLHALRTCTDASPSIVLRETVQEATVDEINLANQPRGKERWLLVEKHFLGEMLSKTRRPDPARRLLRRTSPRHEAKLSQIGHEGYVATPYVGPVTVLEQDLAYGDRATHGGLTSLAGLTSQATILLLGRWRRPEMLLLRCYTMITWRQLFVNIVNLVLDCAWSANGELLLTVLETSRGVSPSCPHLDVLVFAILHVIVDVRTLRQSRTGTTAALGCKVLVLQAWKVASKSVFARLVLLLAVPTTPSRIYMQCADCKQPHASYDRSCAPISSAIWQTSGSGNGPSPRQSLQRKAEAMRGPAMACGQSLPCLHLETMPCYAATDDASGILPASCKHAEALSAPGITSTDLHSTCPSSLTMASA